MEKKRGLIIFIAVFLIIISGIGSVSAIKITPAKISGTFKPNLEREINYFVSSGLNRYLEIYTRGDLAEYINLSTTRIFKDGSFTATIKLPEKLETPGQKNTFIGVREELDKELIGSGGMGTSVSVESRFSLFVPYPGKYVESHLSAHNVNTNEPIRFEIEMVGRGDETVIAEPRIEIFSDTGDLIDVLEFRDREISSGEKIGLKKEWDTSGQSPGRYSAISIIEYGGKNPSEDMKEFRIGELTLDLVNYSEKIPISGMTGFDLVIKSGWNDKIDGAYAEVKIFNNTSPYNRIAYFKTIPTDLDPWGQETITGYFNSSLFEPGLYESDIFLYYYGRDVGRTNRETVNIRFVEKQESEVNYFIWGSVIVGLSLLITVILFLLFKDGSKNKKKKK